DDLAVTRPVGQAGEGGRGLLVGQRVGVRHRRRDSYALPMRPMNSARVLASRRNVPVIAEVTIVASCFLTPRIIVHRCVASTTQATPFGSRRSVRKSATCTVSRSWSWSRWAYMSTIRGIFD